MNTSWKYNTLVGLFFIVLIIIIGAINAILISYFEANWGFSNLFLDNLYHYRKDIIAIVFGFMLNYDHILREWNKNACWKLNKRKLLCLGLPSSIFVIYTPISFMIFQNFDFTIHYVSVFPSTLLGFTIGSSLYKKE